MPNILQIPGVPPSQIFTDLESREIYGRDWTTYYDIDAKGVVFPENTEQVVAIVKWARLMKVALVPSGGRTGLSGGAVATQSELVVSFEKMKRILDFDSTDQLLRVEAGVVTEELQNKANELGLYYPVDFAARGSSQIGGNIATNAGGIKVLRYGMTRDWVKGLKVVTGTGEILDIGRGLIKNATGYDLMQLFVGSEGTLGFVTEALIKLAPKPPQLQVMVLGLQSLDMVMELFSVLREKVSLTAFEFFSDKALAHVSASTGLIAPLSEKCPFYVVAEFDSLHGPIDEIFAGLLEKGIVSDGALAQTSEQFRSFWRLREDISESISKYSPYKNDISVRISRVVSLVQEISHVLNKSYPSWEVIWFGHIGDGNLHINILRPVNLSKEEFVKECRKVDPLIFASVKKHGGAISAEHGVGLSKKDFLSFSRSNAEIELMKSVKKVFDPDQIINPGKIFSL